VHQSVLVGYYVLFDAQLHVPKDDGICICVTEVQNRCMKNFASYIAVTNTLEEWFIQDHSDTK
jgi:CRISPR/Cas system-associated exonuclease Cas4 (RecB family)